VLYLQEFIFGSANFSGGNHESVTAARKNTNNFSLERGKLPMIKEASTEHHSHSPEVKKGKFGLIIKTANT
jgi:hypothetical protein